VIDEVLPDLMFRVRLDDGRAVRASLAPGLRHGIVRLINGCQVIVELSAHDPGRGQITEKL
jgi:translation initiation factor IF-1